MTEADARILNGRTILLVEDEALIAMELEMVLEAYGAQIHGPIPDLASAKEAAETGRFDAAILDVDLCGEDVFPVAKVLQNRNVPFLFHTGHATRGELGEDYPDAPVCKKPMAGDQLARHLAALI
jgi:DNA-binding NtrC family response regulator